MSLKFPKLKTTNCIVAFLSSALQAFGMYNIHALSGVTEGGVLGATLLFDHWFGLSPAVSSFVLNIACYVLGWRTLGKSFIAYSAIADGMDAMEDYYLMDGGIITVNTDTAAMIGKQAEYSCFNSMGTVVEVTTTKD